MLSQRAKGPRGTTRMTEPQEVSTNTPDTRAYVRAFRKHWLLGLVVVFLVMVGAIFYTVGQKRIYQASARLVIDPAPPKPLGNDVKAVVDVGGGSYWGNKEYFETQTKILLGMSLAREVVRTLHLDSDAAFIQNTPAGQRPAKGLQKVDLDVAAAILGSRLGVETVRDTRLVNVTVRDADPERARRVLAALLDIYLEKNVDRVVQSTMAASEWLANQTEKLKHELENTELALHDYKKQKQILSVSLDDQSNMLRGEMQQLSEALTGISAKRESLKARSQELDKVDATDPISLPSTELLNSNALSELRKQFVEARNELESFLGSGKGANHPEVAATAARMESTRQALMAEVKNIQGAIRSDLIAATSEQTGLSALLNAAKQRALDLNMLEIEYRRLERSKQNTEKLFGLVVERSKESELTGMLRFNNIRVEEPPTASKAPVSPRVPVNIAIGLALGLLFGATAVFMRGVFDRTIQSPAELEEEISIPLLGVLPALSEQQSRKGHYHSRIAGGAGSGRAQDVRTELVAHLLPTSRAAECIRLIRTSLTLASPDRAYRRILITSANPGEGKTTVAVSLATAFAEAGQKVLIVDADLRRGRIHRVFDKPNSDGLTSVLGDTNSLDRCLLETGIKNLTLLTTGPFVPNPAELIQSASFARLFSELDARFDRIIIDSPPILAVADGTILATLVDVTVLVVRTGKSRMDIVRQALRKLQEVPKPIAGAILNALESPRWSRQDYSYYYGKGDHDTYGTNTDA